MANEKRLIDANAVMVACRATLMVDVFPNWKDMPNNEKTVARKIGGVFKRILENAPTVDAVEVVHGRWIPLEYDGYADGNPARMNALWHNAPNQSEYITDMLIANGVRLEEKQATSNPSEQFASDNNVGSKWIPVTERLPDESIPSQHYLCWYKGRVRILKYWRTRKCFESNGRVANVTHWKPLPEPPKE